jgi:Leucine-rich repeat (LRR) protein
MKKLILFLAVLCSLSLTAQNIAFTDVNFKTILVNHNPVIDTSGDGEISIDEANFMSHGISVSNSSISNLTGLEHFTNMPEFYCSNNSISSINISTLAALTLLNCSDNMISSIDITLNPGLLRLTISNNNLTTLNASQNTGMLLLSCFNNQLNTINLQNGNNTNMQFSGTGNPNACIVVDNVAYSQGAFNWSEDVTSTYSLSCATTEIKEEEGLSFNFYPNPVINELNVVSPSFSRFEIIDVSGKEILTSYQSTTSLNTLKKGVYFLTVYDLNGNFNTEKIIKQ